MWGLAGSKVIYNFPKRIGHRGNEFFFKFDYSESNASWPRIYALATGPKEPAVRIIAPIIILRRYNRFQLAARAWYDMPVRTHEQILEIVDNSNVQRKLPFWKRVANTLLPTRWQYNDMVPIRDYIFGIILHNGDSIVRVL